MRRIATIGLAMLLTWLPVTAGSCQDAPRGYPAPEIGALATRVDEHYNHLRTLQADFTETYTGAGVSRSESGTVWLKRPGRMRWEYRQPHEKLFLTDGKAAWFYVPGEKQARTAPVRKLEDLRSPLAYLLGKTRLEKEFSSLSLARNLTAENPGDTLLQGVPRHASGIAYVLMEISSDGRIVRMMVAGEDGSTTDFHFLRQLENVSVPDQRFEFSPPPGVETIESEQLGAN